VPLLLLFILALAGCATTAATPMSPAPAAAAAIVQAPAAPVAPTAAAAPAPAATVAPAVAVAPEPAAPATAAAEPDDDDDSEAVDDGEVADEGESHEAVAEGNGELRYTTDLSDGELERRWKLAPATLGSMSVGFVDAGRLVNGERFPDGPDWVVVTPEKTYGTHETVAYLEAAIRKVRAEHPEAPPLRVNQIGVKDGGYLRPHKSHQSGRDCDLGFYYPTVDPVREREREKYINVGLNWALLKAIISETDVQLILVDKHVQKVLYDYALAHGEDKAWLDSLFHAGHASLIQHARRHRDHFHVRFYNPRAQELGRRVAPLLAQQPEYNVAMHKVHNGDNLGKIALKYGSSVQALRKANHLSGNAIRAGITLTVPLRGACTHCPVPPAVVIPERRLSPAMRAALAAKPAPAPAAPRPETQVAAAPAPASPPEPAPVKDPVKDPIAAPPTTLPTAAAPVPADAVNPAVPAAHAAAAATSAP
jgi:murein endopeptidase